MPFPPQASDLLDDLLARLGDDPWSLTPSERSELAASHWQAQQRWLPKLRRLVEPPAPDDAFPAFLLDLPPHRRLGAEIAAAATPADLDVGTADELQRFVDRYRDYLVGDDVSGAPPAALIA
jgi:hypothetical protein